MYLRHYFVITIQMKKFIVSLFQPGIFARRSDSINLINTIRQIRKVVPRDNHKIPSSCLDSQGKLLRSNKSIALIHKENSLVILRHHRFPGICLQNNTCFFALHLHSACLALTMIGLKELQKRCLSCRTISTNYRNVPAYFKLKSYSLILDNNLIFSLHCNTPTRIHV